jgi:DNA replication protein DnaC
LAPQLGAGLSHVEFLELILQDELVVRAERHLQRRVKAANFRELKTLEDIDWSFNPSVKQKQVCELASGRIIREARDVLLLGPTQEARPLRGGTRGNIFRQGADLGPPVML